MSVRLTPTQSAPIANPRRAAPHRGRVRAVVRPLAAPRVSTLQARVFAVVAVGLLLAMGVHEFSGLNRLRTRPTIGSDYLPVAQFVADRHKPGEPVFVAIPPPAYLALGSRNDLIFVSSPLDRDRAQRYTRLTSDGRYVDYWTGTTSIVSTGQLCQAMLSSPDLWLIVDGARLNAEWAYQGDMATVITGLTYIRYYDPSGSMVRRLAPIPSRDPAAEQLCVDEMAKEGLTVGQSKA